MSVRRGPGARHGEPSPVIRVSEIGEYAYCSRAWWYRHVAKVPIPRNEKYGRLAAGTQAHRRHGGWVTSSARLQALAVALTLLGLIALALAIWLYLMD